MDTGKDGLFRGTGIGISRWKKVSKTGKQKE